MRYMTDRQRAVGKGASGTGTEHHWFMTISGVGLAFLVPCFVYIFGSALGRPQAEVIERLSHPFAAIVIALTFLVGMRHFAKGAQSMIEDYAAGTTRKILVIFVYSLSYVLSAATLFALGKMVLMGLMASA
ncbi:succinate dehydrogenase [Thioclava sp. SK-1]|uniref:succinate dehydrogenase, hydrophobic membrane anchor protein n=1 Tax=Thioclava sp. SK-1 TaxID=1889770 RepID=UPI000824FC7C|nr:succinate dehydrogenase, hydrophobic membrane anchor protein [Thioclava sp. SK-1]OCX65882.1 succinate dehydrogenase [Thioclava sp. SK-1]